MTTLFWVLLLVSSEEGNYASNPSKSFPASLERVSEIYTSLKAMCLDCHLCRASRLARLARRALAAASFQAFFGHSLIYLDSRVKIQPKNA